MSDSVVNGHPAQLDLADVPTQRLVEEINQIHGLELSLRRRCAGGQQGGAWVVQSPDGGLCVLKWRVGGGVEWWVRAAAEVNRMIAAGYPTPRWRLVGATATGVCYHLQDFLPGDPASLTPAAAVLMAEVIEKQAGLAADLHRDWSDFVTTMALDDDDPSSARRFVRRLGPDGQGLVEHYDGVLATHDPIRLPRTDLVHGDFSTGNVLIHEGRISGVVDIEALGNGTRVVDYAWLVREVFGTSGDRAAADILRRSAETVADPGVLALCTTATALDMIRWIATHSPEHVRTLLRRMHGLADYLARPL